VVLAAALAVKLAGPVLGALAELLHVFLIGAGVIVGAGAASLVGLLIWRWRCTYKDAARARPPFRGALYPLHGVTRAAQPLPGPRAAIERPREVRLHLHGISAEEIAGIFDRQNE
jgi:hypothetical protein